LKKVLVIGGTKYLGLEFIKLLKNDEIQLIVASRKEIDVKYFFKIDRKSKSDLDKLFSDIEFDVVVDFINYSGIDCKILVNSLKFQKKAPKLILISTVYTYALPLEIKCSSVYDETCFNPLEYKAYITDRPQISYAEGKRNMERYALQNYDQHKLVILRFPIILGANDYTKRTHFYPDMIKNGLKINPNNISNKGSYVFSYEAAVSILNFVNTEHYGIYNVAFEPISEKDLINIFCGYYNCNIDLLLSYNVEPINTPFTSNFDFIVDSRKYHTIFPNKINFENGLYRELSNI